MEARPLSPVPSRDRTAPAIEFEWVGGIALALMACVFALFWPTTASLLEQWQNDVQRTYTHGLLIPAIAAWLLWRNRSVVQGEARFSAVSAVCLVGCAVAWLVAWRSGLQIVHQALLPLIVFGAVATCLGFTVARQMWLPIAYLYFAVPVWELGIGILQSLSVVAVKALLRVVGIPAYFSHNTFQIPAGTFEIADGCSGLHFVIVALAIAVLYGELNRDKWSVRCKLIALAAALAMATNWLRILIIVIAGHTTDMQHYLVAEEHYSFGWVVFAVAMLVFFLIAKRWPVHEHDTSEAQTPIGARSLVVAGATTVVLLAIAPLWNVLTDREADSAESHELGGVSGWRATTADAVWYPISPEADVESIQRFDSGSAQVDVYVGTYLIQRQGKELGGFGSSILGDDLRPVAGAHAMNERWNEVRARDASGNEWLVRSSFRIDERWHVSALEAQLAYGVRSLFGSPVSSVVAMRSRCETTCDGASAALDGFAAANGF